MPADPDFTDLRTDRLLIRRFRLDDAAAFAEYRSDPDVARYQSWEDFTHADADAFVREMTDANPGVPGQWFQFAVTEPANDDLLGDVALCVDADDPTRAELGFTFAPAHQGHGYATDAVLAVIAYAVDRLGVETVVAIADTRNVASVALLERIGMHAASTEHVRFKGEWCDEQTYEVQKG